MFAAQLLKILRTLLADVKNEPSAFDTAVLKVRMKENQGILCHSDGYHNKEDSLSFMTKDLHHSTGNGKDSDPLALQTLERNNFWNSPELEHSAVLEDCSKNNEIEIRVSPMKAYQSGLFYHLSDCERGADSLASDKKDSDKLWNTAELEYSMIVNDFADHNKHEIQDSGSPFLTSSDLFKSDTHLYTDKNMVESELPELIVCKEEINNHVVKDICIDEGMPVEDKGLTDRNIIDCAGLSASLPSKEYKQNEISSGGPDFKLLIPDGPKASSQEDIDDHAAAKCQTKEEMDVVSLVPGEKKCSPEGSINMDGRTAEHLIQTSETKSNGPDKIESNVLEEESLVTSVLPLQEFGTRSFLPSLVNSLNNDGDKVVQQPNQIPSVEANLESFASVSKAEESNESGPANKLGHNSEVENATITFDLNSPNSAVAGSRSMSAATTEQSLKSDNVLNHSDGETNITLAASLVQHANMDGRTVDINQDSMMNSKNRSSADPFIVSEVQSASTDGSTESINQDILVNHKKGNPYNPFAFDEVQSSTLEWSSSQNIHESSILNHVKENFDPFASSEVESANLDRDTENIHQPPMPNPMNRKSNNPFAVPEVQVTSTDMHSESIHQPPMLNHEIGKTTNPFTDDEVQSSIAAGGIVNMHQQPELKHHNGNSSNPFAVSEVQSARMDSITTDIHEKSLVLDNTLDHRDGTDEHLSASNHIQCSSSMAENNEVLHDKSFEPHAGNNQGQLGIGETSFSAAGPVSGLITYSGPIAYSGSTSLRSDSSTTSTRSFAFPILQSEWNSSPVRMRKADEQHFRKNRGWKQGILCCKF